MRLLALVALTLLASPLLAQKPAPPPPQVVADFAREVGAHPSFEAFLAAAEEKLWVIYTLPPSTKGELLAYLASGDQGPGTGFAAIALIPFHDPASVPVMMRLALDPKTKAPTRWCLLNAAPYVLSMGDVMYMGEGKLDAEAREFANELSQLATKATSVGAGRQHARNLRELLDIKDPAVTRDSDYGLALWHASAYLGGTLDLRDLQVLTPAFDLKRHNLFANVMDALSFAANRDFLRDLKDKRDDQITPALEQAASAAAQQWWAAYLEQHPDGDWVPAALAGFKQAGFALSADLPANESGEVLRVLGSSDPILRYNAYRLLNRKHGTSFDLERIFFAGKYALSFLDPSGEAEAIEARLKEYWRQKLNAATSASAK